jgi:hypothetical protein
VVEIKWRAEKEFTKIPIADAADRVREAVARGAASCQCE